MSAVRGTEDGNLNTNSFDPATWLSKVNRLQVTALWQLFIELREEVRLCSFPSLLPGN